MPYFPYKYDEYSDEQKKRFKIKPGITGLAQVRVRNSVSWDERIKIDIEYVNNITFVNDLVIFLRTIKNVIFKKNIYKE